MNRYETLFIIKPDQSDDQIQGVVDRICERIDKAQGKVAAIDHWGNRRLAYTIKYRGERLTRGYYVLLNYVGEGTVVDEVERNIKILDAPFRYFSLKLEDGVDPATVTEVQVTKATPAQPPEPARTEQAPAEGADPQAPAEATASQETPAETPAAEAAPAEAPPAEEAAAEAAPPKEASTEAPAETSEEPKTDDAGPSGEEKE